MNLYRVGLPAEGPAVAIAAVTVAVLLAVLLVLLLLNLILELLGGRYPLVGALIKGDGQGLGLTGAAHRQRSGVAGPVLGQGVLQVVGGGDVGVVQLGNDVAYLEAGRGGAGV